MYTKETKKSDTQPPLWHPIEDGASIPGARLRTDRSGLSSARYYDAPQNTIRFPTKRPRNTQQPDAGQRKAPGKKKKRRWVLPLVMALALCAAGGILMMRGYVTFPQWANPISSMLSGVHTAIPAVAVTPSATPPAQRAALPAIPSESPGTPITGQGITESPQRTDTLSPTAGPSATPQPTAVVATPVVYTTLRAGDEGDAVSQMQRALVALGYLKESQQDGSYGDITRRAVRAFQRVNQLEVDGVAGPQTQQLLYSGDALPNTEE